MPECSVADCTRRVKGHGLCNMHYQRWKNTGTTDARQVSALDRFMKKVDTSGDCWLWTASRGVHGYGKFFLDGSVINAHRASYLLLVGPIDADLQVDHLCRNRLCVNPDHLEAVTQRENLLRGVGITAQCAVVTHCPQGHLDSRQRGGPERGHADAHL